MGKQKEINLGDVTSIGELLKELRKARGITQEGLASYAGLSRVGIVKLERGEGDIKLSSLLKITALLGLDLVLKERGE